MKSKMLNTCMKQRLKALAPAWLWNQIKQTKKRFLKGFRRCFDAAGLTIAKKSDYYSPLPSEFELARTVPRWNKPSRLCGIQFDINAQKCRFDDLQTAYMHEYLELPPYDANVKLGFGPGFPALDALTLYMMVRHFKPKRYLEIGSGLSTYYCSKAAEKNRHSGYPIEITCVEPFPFQALSTIPDIRIIRDQVQNLDFGPFADLEDGDILFIDSSHVVRIDGDVPFLFLEVIPTLKAGVVIHIHDIPFPYNVPFPADQWVLGRNLYSPYWPMYWNEAMLLQGLLSNSKKLDIFLSTPLIRYHDECFLRDRIPFYRTVTEEPNTFSSIWLQVVK
jgi:hypothetical protein